MRVNQNDSAATVPHFDHTCAKVPKDYRLPLLDGLRAFAAVFVVLHHGRRDLWVGCNTFLGLPNLSVVDRFSSAISVVSAVFYRACVQRFRRLRVSLLGCVCSAAEPPASAFWSDALCASGWRCVVFALPHPFPAFSNRWRRLDRLLGDEADLVSNGARCFCGCHPDRDPYA